MDRKDVGRFCGRFEFNGSEKEMDYKFLKMMELLLYVRVESRGLF